MAEKRLKSLLKVRTLLWLGNSAGAAVLLCIWRVTGSVAWLGAVIIYGMLLGYENRSGIRNFLWLYIAMWLVAFGALDAAANTASIIGISTLFGILFFILIGVIQSRFEEPRGKLDIFYFLLVCVAMTLYAIHSPSGHTFGGAVLPFAFLYLGGGEYISAKLGFFNKRIRVYLAGISVMAMETLWVASILSVGYLNVATLTLVLYMTLMALLVGYFQGNFSKKMIYTEVAFFAVFSTVILIISLYA